MMKKLERMEQRAMRRLESLGKQTTAALRSLDYARTVGHFRRISEQTCVRKKLCCTSGENAMLRCAKPAAYCYKINNGETRYSCAGCWLGAGLPKDWKKL